MKALDSAAMAAAALRTTTIESGASCASSDLGTPFLLTYTACLLLRVQLGRG